MPTPELNNAAISDLAGNPVDVDDPRFDGPIFSSHQTYAEAPDVPEPEGSCCSCVCNPEPYMPDVNNLCATIISDCVALNGLAFQFSEASGFIFGVPGNLIGLPNTGFNVCYPCIEFGICSDPSFLYLMCIRRDPDPSWMTTGVACSFGLAGPLCDSTSSGEPFSPESSILVAQGTFPESWLSGEFTVPPGLIKLVDCTTSEPLCVRPITFRVLFTDEPCP